MDKIGFTIDFLSKERRELTIDLPGVGKLVCEVSTMGASTDDQRRIMAKTHAEKLIETFKAALRDY